MKHIYFNFSRKDASWIGIANITYVDIKHPLEHAGYVDLVPGPTVGICDVRYGKSAENFMRLAADGRSVDKYLVEVDGGFLLIVEQCDAFALGLQCRHTFLELEAALSVFFGQVYFRLL